MKVGGTTKISGKIGEMRARKAIFIFAQNKTQIMIKKTRKKAWIVA